MRRWRRRRRQSRVVSQKMSTKRPFEHDNYEKDLGPKGKVQKTMDDFGKTERKTEKDEYASGKHHGSEGKHRSDSDNRSRHDKKTNTRDEKRDDKSTKGEQKSYSYKHHTHSYESESSCKESESESTSYKNTANDDIKPKTYESDKDKFFFFYGMKSPFSQFYPATFEVDGVTYNCAEQYMMHRKAVIFKDYRIGRDILNETKPLKQKRLGRKVSNFDPNVWNQKCQEIVINGNMAKFSQNPLLEKQLIETYPKILAESSPRDCLWGIGLGPNNPKAWNMNTWRGRNLLGKALRVVRDNLMTAKKMLK